MRETRKLLTTVSSRSSPITYQVPFSGRSAYGLIVRSRSSSRAIDQYAKLDRALLRDRRLELAEPALELGRVVGVAHLDPHRGRGRRALEHAGRAAEREVLQREPERLGVGEAALEQVEAGLERRELVVVELERRQEVALGAERVELLAGELVALRVERHAERRRARRGRSRSGARTPRRSSPGSPRRST